MFKFLGDDPYHEDIDVLISFHQDIQDRKKLNCEPEDILMRYMEEFPEFSNIILEQYIEDKEDGFPNDEEIAQSLNLFLQPKSATTFIISQESLRDAFNYFNQCLYTMFLNMNRKGKIINEIEQRLDYLDECYDGAKSGYSPQLKDW